MIDVDYYCKEIYKGNRRILSKAITLVESKNHAHRKDADKLIDKIRLTRRDTFRIAISGVPGVGKSTFIESFGLYLIKKGKRVAVLAIDPSSSFSGGSILGDKTRMDNLSVNENAFVRPTPTGGNLGGIARNTYESILLCESAGFDVILIETVGVGQSEILAKNVSDFFLFLSLVGAGDELQGIKRGIMEIVDLIFINKVDSNEMVKVKQTIVDLKNAIHLFPMKKSGEGVNILSGSAIQGKGIENVWKNCCTYLESTKKSSYFESNRQRQLQERFRENLTNGIKDLLFSNEDIKTKFSNLLDEVNAAKTSPYKAAKEFLDSLKISENK